MYTKTADEIMAMDPEMAIIAVGSVEQHGPHLPVMTDWIIATEMGKRVAQKMNAFLLPALPISTCREHMGKKGCVWMEPMTFYQMMTDIILSLKLQGFKKVGILQCHGGIFVMTPLVRDLNAKFNPDLMVAVADFCDLMPLLQKEGVLTDTGELHAGQCETSCVLASAPETVHMDRAVSYVPEVPRKFLSYGSIFRASPSGVWGDPSEASAQIGEQVYERGSQLMVQQLKEAFAYMEAKEPINYSNF